MRELDELLLRYLNGYYVTASADEKAAFQEVLALSDPELNGYLLQREIPSSTRLADVIKIVLSLPHAE